MEDESIKRAKMPEGTARVLERRTLYDDYRTLLPILKKGMNVLDVGCGTGSIATGIADIVGNEGSVTGIDSSDQLIFKAKETHNDLKHLYFFESDLFSYNPEEKFDLVISARVLQWLKNPVEALRLFTGWVKPEGYISILDYNHTGLQWEPLPPESMIKFYTAFLEWRKDVGMDNEIGDHMAGYFARLQIKEIQTFEANEFYDRKDNNFFERVSIWSTVAETRGKQMVESGILQERDRLLAIEEYNLWLKNDAKRMVMKLIETRGCVY
jgi:ubiquinone/menaquinone biosynthesis C-methylase UbiE